jgi:hypothetical protein
MGQDNSVRTASQGQLGLDIWNRTAFMGQGWLVQPGQVSLDRTAGTGQLGQVSLDRLAWAGQIGQVSRDRSAL